MTRTNSDEVNGGGSTFRSNVIKDGVLRYPPTSVKVVIVGGGISGLFAALECWRKGHDVQVVERGSNISEAGKRGPHDENLFLLCNGPAHPS